MSKRCGEFPRRSQDSYDTPAAAAAPLLALLARRTRFIEPCVGNGCLVGHLKRAGHILLGAYSLPHDARTMLYDEVAPGVLFITNPP
jgi:hypothetical protein